MIDKKLSDKLIHNHLVTVIIPSYRRDIFLLSRAIKSVLDQTYKNIEIIVIDDNAGADNSNYRDSVVRFFNDSFKDNNNISLVLNKVNLGGALSRNEGLKKARGYYIAFLDDDDYYLENKIKNQVLYMEENNLDFSFTDLHIYNKDNKLVDIRDRSDIERFDSEYLLKYHIVKNLTGTETFMGKRELYLSIGGFDNVITGHEFFLMIKVLKKPNIKIGYYKSSDIVAYRTSLPSISNGPNKIKGEKDIYIKKKEYFYLLNSKEKRYVKCRHHAVLGITYYRRHKYVSAFFEMLFSFLISPKIVLSSIFTKKR